MTDRHPYTWKKRFNGVGSIAIVEITIAPSASGRNQIIERYSGQGFVGQGYIESVPESGYDSWKLGARRGLEYAFSLINTNWMVTIHKIEGRALTDTNPAVVGYTVLRAFFEKINFQLDTEQIELLEKFVLSSWKKPYQELIPDFLNFTFKEYQL
jgi:hypothetical protein